MLDRSLGIVNGTHCIERAWVVEVGTSTARCCQTRVQDTKVPWRTGCIYHISAVKLCKLAVEDNCNIKKTQWQINAVYCFKTKYPIPTNVTKSGYQGYQNSFPVQLRLYPVPEIRHTKLVNKLSSIPRHKRRDHSRSRIQPLHHHAWSCQAGAQQSLYTMLVWISYRANSTLTGCCVTMSPLSEVMGACWVGSMAAGILKIEMKRDEDRVVRC